MVVHRLANLIVLSPAFRRQTLARRSRLKAGLRTLKQMLTIIGCGNSNRTDDGAGVYVAQHLQKFVRENPKENVKIFDAGTGGIDVMFHARGSTRLIIIDASQSGSEAGAIYEVPGEELEREREVSYSLHDFRWDDALFAGRKIFKEDFPKDVSVFLIEAESLDYGLELSPKVKFAADIVIERLRKIINEYV
jgi:hydrogenase maturation protease